MQYNKSTFSTLISLTIFTEDEVGQLIYEGKNVVSSQFYIKVIALSFFDLVSKRQNADICRSGYMFRLW